MSFVRSALLALAAFALSLSATLPANAQIRGTQVEQLAERARQHGSTRVILELRRTQAMEGGQARAAIKASQDRAVRELAPHGLKRLRQYEHVPFVAAELTEPGLRAALSHPDVAAVHEDRLHRPTLADSGPLIGAPDAWSLGFTGAGQQIAILDTGVDRTHPFRAGKVVQEACFSSTFAPDDATGACPNGQETQTGPGAAAPCSAQDDCFHGTHVAGIAAGNGPNAVPPQTFSGIAKDANIIAIQVFSVFVDPGFCGTPSPCAAAYTSDLIAALDYVFSISPGFSIASVNMSLSGGSFTAACDTDPLKPGIDKLRSAGIATVVASGNDGFTNALGSPACISSAISVGATTKAPESVASFTNRASFLKLLAPGVSIRSSVPGGAYASFSGTSMATPHVAGAVALLKQKRPNASVTDILAALASTGVPIPDVFVGPKPRISLPPALNAIVPAGAVLAVSPAEGLVQSGPPGGPFSPASKAYTLINTGVASLNFTASSAASWVTVSPASGSLAPGAGTTVTVSINNPDAASRAAGIYTGTVVFSNTTNNVGSTTRALTLNVVAPIPPGTNALVFFSQPGDFIGMGQNRQMLGTDPGISISAFPNFQGGVSLNFLLANGQRWSADFAPPPGLGAAFAAGAYENAVRFPFNNGLSPGLSLTGDGRGCNTLTGRFDVLEVAFNPADGSVLKFAADFVQHCEGFDSALFGQVRFNSNVPVNLESALPAPFSFFPAANVALGAQVVSNAVSITGITNAPISVQGGEYSIDGGAFTNVPGTIANGQSVRLRLAASNLPGTNTFATVKVGAASATFQASTVLAAGTNILYFHSNPGDFIGQGQQRGMYAGTGFVLAPAPGAVPGRNLHNGISFSISGGGQSWTLDFSGPNGAQLAPGSYENAMRYPFESAGIPGLNFSGDGRGCNTLGGRFDVLEVVYNGNGTIQSFAADFVQHCEGVLPALFGQIRFNSTAPVYTDAVLPTAFAFVDNFDALPNAPVASNAVTISGIVTAPVRVQGGAYSINGGPFTSNPGTISNGQTLALRVQTGAFGTTSFATVRVGAAIVPFMAIAGTGQQGTITGIQYASQPGDFIGQGEQRLLDASSGFTLTPSRNSSGGVSFRIESASELWNLDLSGPAHAPLAVGSYENAVRFPFETGLSPGISLTGRGRGCNTVSGRFDVLEVAYAADGRVTRFAADFAQHCEGGAPALFGQIRYNANTPINTAPVLPAPFAFIPALDVPRGVVVTSNTVTISGITTAPISVQGGEYSINGGAFTSLAGTITNAQTLALRLTSSSAAGTATFATVRIGAASATFQATTVIANVGTNVLFFKSDPGDFVGLGQTRFLHAGSGFTLAPSRNFDNGVSFSINGSAQLWFLDFASGNSASSPALAPGAYEGAARFPFQGPGQPGLSFSGDGRGCNTVSGRFDVLDATYGAGGAVNSFAANFEQHCEGGASALRGRIRYNTSVPLFGSIRHDHSGDGKSDVLWRNSLTGENYLYPMSGTAILAAEGFLRTVADLNWQIVGSGDFDGDGKTDVLWRNAATGQNYVYFMDGRTIKPSEGFLRTVDDLSWKVAGVGDFDGDGKADILWRNDATGDTYIYLMDGRTIKGEGFLRTVADPSWQIAGVGDFDGDGKADVLWRNASSGQNYLYPLDGLTIKPSEGFIRTVPPASGWQVVGR